MSASTPIVSVVVPTRQRAPLLSRLVAALEVQADVGAFEVIVVDDASADGTGTALERLASAASIPVRAVRLAARRGPAGARNVGWRLARAPLVAFTDDDCVPQPGWLAALGG